jgi:excisionase family DNA binding protein
VSLLIALAGKWFLGQGRSSEMITPEKLAEKKAAGEYLTTREASEILKITAWHVQRLCRDGVIGSSHPGRKYLIPVESLEEYLKIRR